MSSSTPQRGLFPIRPHKKSSISWFPRHCCTVWCLIYICVALFHILFVGGEKWPGKLHKLGSRCVTVSVCFAEVMLEGFRCM